MKICFICFEFENVNINRQPWKYVYELSSYFIRNCIDVVIISNSHNKFIDKIRIHNVASVRSIFGEPKFVLDAIEDENPDVVFLLLGPTSFLRFNFKINRPIVGIFTSPIYSLKDVLCVGFYEFVRNYKYVFIHVIGCFIPESLFRLWSTKLNYIVVLSEANRNRLAKMQVKSTIFHIPPGIDQIFLEQLEPGKTEQVKRIVNNKGLPKIIYFTSPLTIRGTDVLVKSFARVRKTHRCELIILARIEYESLYRDIKLIENIANKEGVFESVKIITERLSKSEIKNCLSMADIICLPFKIVLSDAPLSLLESMALGKPIISTKIGCIPDMLKGRGLIAKPNNVESLSDMILELLNNKYLSNVLGDNSKKYMENYLSWDDVGSEYMSILNNLSVHTIHVNK